jgi:phospholipid:diacylglycerol acyltransferase
VALFFANQHEVISLDALMDLNLESLIDVVPAGLVRDAKEFSVRVLLYVTHPLVLTR